MLKSDAGRDLVAAVETISKGRLFFTSSVSNVLKSDYGDASDAHELSPARMSAREREILQLLAEGKTNKEVALQIHTSVKTVENYRAKLMKQLNLSSLSDLVRYAIQNELIVP